MVKGFQYYKMVVFSNIGIIGLALKIGKYITI